MAAVADTRREAVRPAADKQVSDVEDCHREEAHELPSSRAKSVRLTDPIPALWIVTRVPLRPIRLLAAHYKYECSVKARFSIVYTGI